ncbi:MAG: hypothetical protein K8S56_09565 [Candidatus Cloacimonetes bacterium]|nr:hypothetical protein [Candidatus Cloacimonadota bacterium]
MKYIVIIMLFAMLLTVLVAEEPEEKKASDTYNEANKLYEAKKYAQAG